MWDVLRWSCLGLWTVSGVMTLEIMRVYWWRYKMAPPKGKLLPAHVAAVSSAYFLVSASALGPRIDAIGDGFSWYLILNVIGLILGLVALVIIWKHVHKPQPILQEIPDRRGPGRRASDHIQGSFATALPMYIAAVVTVLVVTSSLTAWQTQRKYANENRERIEQQAHIAKQACVRNNVVREAQALVLSDQVQQTEVALAKPGGLGELLEPYRKVIETQQKQRKTILAKLLAPAGERVSGRPYAIDCSKA